MSDASDSDGAGQRLAILFTDVEGSTELRNRRGDAAADEILRIHEGLVRRQIADHHGDELLFLGDGFMASFATVADALASAIGIQQALDVHNQGDPDRRVRVRIGVHVGEVSSRDGTLYGQAVHAASRIAALAAGGQIFVSTAVREQASEQHGTVDRGLFWLKGFPERWRVYEVEWGQSVVVAPSAGLAPFVERDLERADLRQSLGAALGGHGSLVLITGEAGIGKSRLVHELAADAEARGARVLIGHAVEMEGATPYLPFVEILEQALVSPQSSEAFREALGDAGPELARMVPGLRRAIPDLPQPIELPADQARRFLWISVQEFLERASRVQPLMLVLEDLHWADESTLLLLEHLAPTFESMPELCLGTYRDNEVGSTHPLARTVAQLRRRRLATRIPLEPLTGTGVAALVRGLARQEPPPDLLNVIGSESEGNPFFVEEVFLHLAESGRLLDQEGRFRTDLRMEEFDVPETVRLVIGERLGRLSDGTRDVLAAAATSGRTFDPEVVAHAAHIDAAALLAALDEAERASVIGPAEAGGTRHSFTHELTRQTLLAEISSVKRQDLHARTAAALESVDAEDVEEHAAEVAYHLGHAGPGVEPHRFIRYLRLAGDQAATAAVFDEAVAHFEHALELVAVSDEGARAEILERLAMALRNVGRWDDALRTMNSALDLYEALGQTESLARLAWAMVYQLSWAARFQEAVEVAQRTLAAIGDAPNPDRGRIASAAAWAVGLSGDHTTSTAMFEQARALAEHIGDEGALADILHMETINHLGFAEFEQGVESGLAAAKVFEANGALWDLASVLSFVAYEAGTVPHIEQATEVGARVAPLAERLGHLGATFMSLADRVRREGILPGDLDVVDGLGHEMVEVCERGGLPWLYVGHMHLGLAAHWRDDRDEAERRLRLAVELEPPAAFAGQSASLLALHLAYAGRIEEALTIIDNLRASFPQEDRVNSLGSWNVLFAAVEVLAIAGRDDESGALYTPVAAALEYRGEWITFDGRLTRTRAAIAAAAGRRWDEAEAHYLSALEWAEGLPHRIEVADLRRWYAAMLLQRDNPGDGERAQRLLEDAIESYRSMGMPAMEARARSMLTSPGD